MTTGTLDGVAFDYIRELVQRRTAIVLDPGKEYLVESRLLPLAREAGTATLTEFVARLRTGSESSDLHAKVLEAMTTNETSWFRDHHPFDAVRTEVLPALLESRAATRRISVWSAACSSGQEPYGLAMLLREALDGKAGWRGSILATDYSQEMLDRARVGRYSQLEVNRGLPATSLVKWFTRAGTEWQVADPLRELVTFQRVNLAQPFPVLPKADVVFLRNVLIYFDVETKREVLDRVRAVMAPDGYLFLGGAETTMGIHDGFERVPMGRSACYRLRGAGAGR